MRYSNFSLPIFLLSFSSLFFTSYAQNESDSKWIELSFHYLEQNKLDSAEIALKNELNRWPANPINPFLLNNLGTIQRRQGKFEEALTSYTAALGTYPKNKIFLSDRASLFAEMNKAESALLDYTALLQEYPNDEEALYQRGLLYLQVKNMEGAELDFQKMLELNPDGLYPRMGFASLAKFRGQYEEAEKIYNYLLDKEPELPQLYAGRAELYLLMNKGGKASDDATRAIRLSANSPSPYLYIIRYRAKLLLREKKGAEEDLKRAIELGYVVSGDDVQ